MKTVQTATKSETTHQVTIPPPRRVSISPMVFWDWSITNETNTGEPISSPRVVDRIDFFEQILWSLM